MAKKKTPPEPPADPFPNRRVYFGKTTQAYVAEKKERKQKAREKKFPTMREANRPIPKNRQGPITPQEKKIIELILEDQPQEVTELQVQQIAALTRRNPETIKNLIFKARDKFAGNGPMYVEVHAKAVQSAYHNGEFDTALRGAQWAMENLSSEGVSVIDAASKGKIDNSPKVMIGVNLGGLTPKVE